MTIIFPRLGDQKIEAFVQPFGRMMLAFGRATTAIIALAELGCGSEVLAAKYVSNAGTRDIPKRMRRLLRGTLDDYRSTQMDRALNKYKEIAAMRHHLVHGEWWFDVFDGGKLVVRRVRDDEIEHRFDVTPHTLETWAIELEALADEVDEVDYSIRSTLDLTRCEV